MTPVSPNGSIALAILQRAAPIAQPGQRERTQGQDLTAAANGVPPEQISGASARSTRLRSDVSESLFDASSPSLTEMKLDLFERLGKAIGLELSNFESVPDFGRAIKSLIQKLRAEPGGALALQEIEKELGLDKLGVSIDKVVGAMIDPRDNEELNEALKEQLAESTPVQQLLAATDEIGIYGVGMG